MKYIKEKEFDIYVNKDLEKYRVTQIDLEDIVCNYYLKKIYSITNRKSVDRK